MNVPYFEPSESVPRERDRNQEQVYGMGRCSRRKVPYFDTLGADRPIQRLLVACLAIKRERKDTHFVASSPQLRHLV